MNTDVFQGAGFPKYPTVVALAGLVCKYTEEAASA